MLTPSPIALQRLICVSGLIETPPPVIQAEAFTCAGTWVETTDSVEVSFTPEGGAPIVSSYTAVLGDAPADIAAGLAADLTANLVAEDVTVGILGAVASITSTVAGKSFATVVTVVSTAGTCTKSTTSCNHDLTNLVLCPGSTGAVSGITQVGDGFTTSHSLDADGDLGVEGDAEIDGMLYADGGITPAFISLLDDAELRFGDAPDVAIDWSTVQTNDALVAGLGASNTIIFCEYADRETDFAVAASADPQIAMQSHDATAPTHRVRLLHNDVDGVVAADFGAVRLTPASGSVLTSATAFTADAALTVTATGTLSLDSTTTTIETNAKTITSDAALDIVATGALGLDSSTGALETNATTLTADAAFTVAATGALGLNTSTGALTTNATSFTSGAALDIVTTTGDLDLSPKTGIASVNMTDDGATGAVADLHHTTANPAIADAPGELRVTGTDDGGGAEVWSRVKTIIDAVTAATESSHVDHSVMCAGTERTLLSLDGATASVFVEGVTPTLTTLAGTNLNIVPGAGGITKVGAGTPAYLGTPTNNDLYVGGRGEVAGECNIVGILSARTGVNPHSGGVGSGQYNLQWNGNISAWGGFIVSPDDGLLMVTGASNGYANNNIVITQWVNKDHDHTGLSTNPTLLIQSATNPDSDNTQWISLAHAVTQGVITTGGATGLHFAPGSGALTTSATSFTADAALTISSGGAGVLSLDTGTTGEIQTDATKITADAALEIASTSGDVKLSPAASIDLNGGVLFKVTTEATGTHDTAVTEHIILCTYTATGPVAVTLTEASTRSGQAFVVKDAGGAAFTNNITLSSGIAQAENYECGGTWIETVEDVQITVTPYLGAPIVCGYTVLLGDGPEEVAAGLRTDLATKLAAEALTVGGAGANATLTSDNPAEPFTTAVVVTSTSGTCTKTTTATVGLIDGAVSKAINADYDSLSIVCDGTNWHVI